MLSDRILFFSLGGGEKRRGLIPLGRFLFFPCFYPAVRTGSSNTHFFPWFFFFWWSLAPDLRFSLGQTNTRRVFRYTGKGFYLELP